MLKIALLQEISKQINLLRSELKEVEKREAGIKNGPVGYYLMYSIKNLFHNEVRIKSAKVTALNKLEKQVKAENRDGFLGLSYSYARNRFSPVFLGINNRTESLFEKAADYFVQAEKVKRVNRSYQFDL